MELNDYELEVENIDDVDDEPDTKKNNKKRAKKGLLTALLVTGICILLILVFIVACFAYVYKTGQISFSRDNDSEKPVYTETQMQEMLAAAEDDAEALREAQIAAAEEEGYQLGRIDLLNFIRETLLSTNSSIQTFTALYPDYLVVVSKGAYHFLPVDKSLRLSKLVASQLNILDNGEIQYLDEAGNVSSYKGIDVSAFQGNIDWDKVAADGVDFAFVRVFYRGYESGKLVQDDKGEDNIKGAIDSGVHTGVYVFSQAITVEEAIEEANEAIAVVEPYGKGIPIAIDVERVAGKNVRTDALSVSERTDIILAFCNTVEEAGYKPIIYFNTEMGGLYVDNARVDGISKWYAWYAKSLYYPYEYDIWQYSDSGKINGINGNVDVNVAFTPFWE